MILLDLFIVLFIWLCIWLVPIAILTLNIAGTITLLRLIKSRLIRSVSLLICLCLIVANIILLYNIDLPAFSIKLFNETIVLHHK